MMGVIKTRQLSIGECGEHKAIVVRDMIEMRGKQALRWEVFEEEHLEIYRGLMTDRGMWTYLHGPMDYAKKLK